MFTANRPACGDSKHSRAWLQFGLAIICHSCDNACWLQVCGWPHRVYLEMNLKSSRTGKAHNQSKKKKKWSLQWGGSGRQSKVIAVAPVGQDANTGVNALRTSSNKHLLILRGMLWGMLFDMFHVDCIQGIAVSILVPCHGKGFLLTAALHLSNKVTVSLRPQE